MEAPLPYIAVVTPTKNRRQHLEFQVEQMKQQTYPIERIMWIITDSSNSSSTSWEEIIDLYPNVAYKALPSDTTLGESRNISLDIVTALNPKPEYIFFLDDDDIVHRHRFIKTVKAMQENPTYNVAGCSNVLLFLIRGQDLVEIGSLTDYSGGKIHHALEPTLCVKYNYITSHFFDNEDKFGRLPPFLRQWSEPILQLDPWDTCIIIGHDTSTFDKYQVVAEENKKKFNVVRHEKWYGFERVALDWCMSEELVALFRIIHDL
jgi:glycosyltransferase involved in cell wall biosynthesis